MMPRAGWTHLNLKALHLIGSTQQLLQFPFGPWTGTTSRETFAKDIRHKPQLLNVANWAVRIGCSTDFVPGCPKEVGVRVTEFIEHLEAPTIFGQQDSLAQAVLKTPAEIFASTSPKPWTLCRHGRRLVVRSDGGRSLQRWVACSRWHSLLKNHKMMKRCIEPIHQLYSSRA